MFNDFTEMNISGSNHNFSNTTNGNINIAYHDSASRRSQVFDLLLKSVATNAFHNSREASGASKWHPCARVATILDDVYQWAGASNHTVRIQWVYGTSGSGKSTLLRTLAEMLERDDFLLASFFFSAVSPRRNDTTYFISTIAYQIGHSIPTTLPHIERAIENDPLIFDKSLQAQAKALIVLPLTQAHKEDGISKQYPNIIMVDGLDQCASEGEQHDLLRVVNMILEVPLPLAFLIASRPEPNTLALSDSDLSNSFWLQVEDCDADDHTHGPDRSAAVPLLRSYSSRLGNHFYTTDQEEMVNATANLGYVDEGTSGFIFPSQKPGTVPLYRAYQPRVGDHFYTIDKVEMDNAVNKLGYNDEGITGHVYSESKCGAQPLYRLYNGGAYDHFYTMSATERDNASEHVGYAQEGIAAYIYPA